MKKINRNFFKPSMFICLCLITVTLISATECRPPGPPENPRSLTLGKIGAQLNLLHRVMTAVGAIMRYRISYRYKGGLWNVWTSKAKLFRVRLVGLLEGKNVQFRVSAINAEEKVSHLSRVKWSYSSR